MGLSTLFLLLCLWLSFFILGTHELQSSQTQVLLQLRKQLEYPKQLDIWFNSSTDLCYLSSPQVNISCQNNIVSELRIVGDKPNKVSISNFHGSAFPDQTLSENFSMDSFVTTLTRLTSLRVLSLVSLGIWGPIPDKIHRFYSLEYLDLSWNFLFGSIPPPISRIANLQTITLDGNFFNGTFPDWFGSLSKLTNLSLRNNRLTGSLLPSIRSVTTLTYLDLSNNEISGILPSMPKSLVMIFLGNNSFNGEIPQQFSQLHQLQKLDLSSNSLGGTPPATLFSLPSITYLNLASNMLSGSLSAHLRCGFELGLVNISNNRLSGWLPSCLSATVNNRVVSYWGNCLSFDLSHQHPETYCIEAQTNKKDTRTKNLGLLLGVIGGLFLIMVLLVFGSIILCRKFCSRETAEQHLLHKSVHNNSVVGFPSELITNARFISEAAKLGAQSTPVHRSFTFDELKEATNSFDKSTLMGEGSNGKLCKGRLENGTQVAIRRLTVSKKYTLRNLRLRLDLLAKLRHPHLVCLLGHCIDSERRDESGANIVYLVYEYVPNGNYRAHLSEESIEKGLKWSGRLAVLIGVAKAVHFLHTGLIPGFFNNRLKSTNVLMNEHGMAKLKDYGLSIVAEEIDIHKARDEGLDSWQMKTLEDDVYSFGFILLESLVGPSKSARKYAVLLNEMASFGSQDERRQIVDPTVLASSSQESLSIVISITNKCISPDPSARPSFEDILWNLQYAAQVQATTEG
ncbi:hypothetical protein LguiB_022967 [Lonicera macranthoides]